MISTLKRTETSCTDPYRNLAAEKLLTLGVREGECILFLWQNRRTVVIGRNQNPWEECAVKLLEADGGHLARRPSGGGAVYHDLGNLNFTFAVRKADWDPEKQSEVILRAVRALGVPAGRTGRNDFEAGGRKFSGNAYYETRGCCCHHGTLMLDVDMDAVSRYLTVSGAKLRSRGVASVRSRVVNLKELCPDITLDSLKAAVTEAFADVYRLEAEPLEPGRLREEDLVREAAALSGRAWLFPPRIPFSAVLENRYAWGGIRVELAVRGDQVVGAECISDAMDERLIRGIRNALQNCPFSGEALAARVAAAAAGNPGGVGADPAGRTGRDVAELLRAGVP